MRYRWLRLRSRDSELRLDRLRCNVGNIGEAESRILGLGAHQVELGQRVCLQCGICEDVSVLRRHQLIHSLGLILLVHSPLLLALLLLAIRQSLVHHFAQAFWPEQVVQRFCCAVHVACENPLDNSPSR